MKSETDVLDRDLDRMLLGRHDETVHVGVDRVELEEFGRILALGGEEFLASVYTSEERAHCKGRLEKLATRFAAKEAASKALGTGLRAIGLAEVEVVTAANGQPRLRLHGRAKDRAAALGVSSISVSLTHTAAVAEAFVVALALDPTPTDSLRKESTL
jgi:holo-[acyl-carrier protein] synthase